jgi:hypothetical protein
MDEGSNPSKECGFSRVPTPSTHYYTFYTVTHLLLHSKEKVSKVVLG